MDIIAFLTENADVLLSAALALLTVAALFVKITPNTIDDKAVSLASKALTALRDYLRVRKAADKATETAKSTVGGVVSKITAAVTKR